ncbi:hypothetical protein GCM10010269_60710 [Streptomyces humidus]|uniref:Uncharacterized protein n=1 Tax=Streptomyces humidus TaxID=52259 RepID=A0A918G2D5_9ACTN|nr:hypothetical protein GCM10010269_60710 [Streptomyces humidus]
MVRAADSEVTGPRARGGAPTPEGAYIGIAVAGLRLLAGPVRNAAPFSPFSRFPPSPAPAAHASAAGAAIPSATDTP